MQHPRGLDVSIPRSGFWVFKLMSPPWRCQPPSRFNPSVGILGVQAGRRWKRDNLRPPVSIPRSGFWVFKHFYRPAGIDTYPGFNPSVGILGVQARAYVYAQHEVARFQSLGRDSGCSSPRNEQPLLPCSVVSIPRSGFWVFKPAAPSPRRRMSGSFNPSVGILGVQASRRC